MLFLQSDFFLDWITQIDGIFKSYRAQPPSINLPSAKNGVLRSLRCRQRKMKSSRPSTGTASSSTRTTIPPAPERSAIANRSTRSSRATPRSSTTWTPQILPYPSSRFRQIWREKSSKFIAGQWGFSGHLWKYKQTLSNITLPYLSNILCPKHAGGFPTSAPNPYTFFN